MFTLGVIGFAVTSYTFIEAEGTGMVTVTGPVNFSDTLSVRIIGGYMLIVSLLNHVYRFIQVIMHPWRNV